LRDAIEKIACGAHGVMYGDDMENTSPEKLAAWLRENKRRNAWLARQCMVHGSAVGRWLSGDAIPQRLQRAFIQVLTDGAVDAQGWERSTARDAQAK